MKTGYIAFAGRCRFPISLRQGVALLLIVAMLGGCAAKRLHREGLTLLEMGKAEEGLAKLQEAAKADPDNLSYRAAFVRNREQAVNRLLALGNNGRITGQPDVAQAAYQQVLRMDADNKPAADGLAMLEMDKRHNAVTGEVKSLIQQGDLSAAQEALKPVFIENPKNEEALALQRKIDELVAKERSAAPALTAKFKKPVTLQFRDANVKMVFEALSRTSGINILLDKDVKQDIKTSIFVKDMSVEDAINLILLQSQLEKKIISDNTVLVYPNTPEKIRNYQDLKVRSFHLTNADPKQMLTMIKTLLKTKDIFVHEKTNSIIMRDTPDAVRLAEKMVADQDIPEPEVMMEVEVLEVSRNRLDQIGINWPSQLSLTAMGGAVAAGTPTVNELRALNGSSIVTSPALGLTLNLMLQDSDTNLLASPRIRARNREKARILIGDRVPVITNAVTPVSTGSPVVTGNVQYLDVGLKLEVEPDIHLDNEVAIKINMEVSSIVKEVPNAISGTLAYQVGTRNASTLLQLKDGETQILAGLINNEDRETANKVPGLGQLPMLGRLFSSHGDNKTKTEIILSITPHIVGKPRPLDAWEVEYWSGTEATLRDKQFTLKPAGIVTASSTGGADAMAQGAAQTRRSRQQMPGPTPTPAAPAAGAQPMVLSWQGPDQAKVGDRISLTLNTQSAQEVGNLGFMVNFDPAVLKVAEVVAGDFMQQDNAQANFTSTVNQANGLVTVSLSGSGAGAVEGTGSVATLMFEVTGSASQSQVTLSRVVLSGAGGQEMPYAAPAPHSFNLSN